MNLMHTIKNLQSINEDNAIQQEIDEANVFQANLVKKALGIARKSSGNYDKAYDQIEKIKKGLADFPIVTKALKTANEGVEQNNDLDALFEEALNESVDLDALFEEELREDYFTVQYYNGNGNLVDDKFKNFKTKAEADKYAKKGNSVDRVGGKYKTFKVKGRMESVEVVETIKKGDVFTKKEALAYFKKERKDFKPSELKKFKNKGGKVVNHWQDGETGEVLPMKESVEVDEAVNTKSIMSELKKKISLLKTETKNGNINDIITRLESIEIFLSKSVKDLKKTNESVEVDEGFFNNIKPEDYSNADFQQLNIKKIVKAGFTKFNPDTIEDVIFWLNMAVRKHQKGKLSESVNENSESIGKKVLDEASNNAIISAIKIELKGRAGRVLSPKQWSQILFQTHRNLGLIHADKLKPILKKAGVEIKEEVELEEVRSPANVSLEKSDGYEVFASGKSSAGVMYFLSYKGKIVASGSKKDGKFIFGFKHKDIHPNSRYKPAGMVKKGKDFTHMGFKSPKEIIAFAKNLGITEDIKLDEVSRRGINEARTGYVGTISGGNSIAIKIDGIDDGEARLGTRNGMKAIDAFKKTAKKTYVDAKGKKTVPAVKKELKLQGAKQYYAKWKSDSPSYKDDSVEVWFTK